MLGLFSHWGKIVPWKRFFLVHSMYNGEKIIIRALWINLQPYDLCRFDWILIRSLKNKSFHTRFLRPVQNNGSNDRSGKFCNSSGPQKRHPTRLLTGGIINCCCPYSLCVHKCNNAWSHYLKIARKRRVAFRVWPVSCHSDCRCHPYTIFLLSPTISVRELGILF